MSRGTRSSLALVLAATAVFALACSGDDSASERPITELQRTVAQGVDGEIWVFGGFGGRGEGRTPMTGTVPADWVAFQRLDAYDVEGRLVRRLELPIAGTDQLSGASAVTIGGERYLPGNTCTLSLTCSDPVPVMFQIGEDRATAVPVRLPAIAPKPTRLSAHEVTVVGGAAGRIWLTHNVAEDVFDRYRVLALDPRTGRATELPELSGLHSAEGVCATDDRLFAMTLQFDGGRNVEGFGVFTRSTNSSPEPWEQIAAGPLQVSGSSGGDFAQLDCLPDGTEVLITLNDPPARLLAVTTTTGEVVETAPPERPRHTVAVLEDGQSNALVITTDVGRHDLAPVWRYVGSDTWRRVGDFTSAWNGFVPGPVLVAGRVYDARRLTERPFAQSAPPPVLVGR